MKIVSILGSPRKKGNTATVLGWVEDELKARGHEVDRVTMADHDVNGCKECYTCQKKPGELACPQKDDGVEIFRRMIAADAILYASPLFCWSWSSQIKTLIDRHFCLVTGAGTSSWSSLIDDKGVAVLITSAGPREDNSGLLLDQFTKLAGYTRARVLDSLLVPLCTDPDAIPVEVKDQAVKLAQKLTGN
jgi:multimeric flavodoxin WrbA